MRGAKRPASQADSPSHLAPMASQLQTSTILVSLLYFPPSASAESEAIHKFLSRLETGKNSLQGIKWGAVHVSGVYQFQLH